MFHFVLTYFILLLPPPSPTIFPSLIFFLLFLLILIFAPADLSSLTIPCEEEEEEEAEEEKEEEETYDDIDGFDAPQAGSQRRVVALPGPTDREEDIYEVLAGETLHLLSPHLPRLSKTLVLGEEQNSPPKLSLI